MGFYVNILNGGFWRTWFKTHRSRIGWRPSSFLGTMTKGCKTPKPSLLEGLARLYPLSIGQQSPWDLQEEWEVRGNWPGGEALTLILRLPRALVDSSHACGREIVRAALRQKPWQLCDRVSLSSQGWERNAIAELPWFYAYSECIDYPQTQLQRAGCPDTEDNDRGCRWRIRNVRNQGDTDGMASLIIHKLSLIINCTFRWSTQRNLWINRWHN